MRLNPRAKADIPPRRHQQLKDHAASSEVRLQNPDR